MEKSILCYTLTSKSMHWHLSRTVLDFLFFPHLICAYFSPDLDKTTILLEKVILWIDDLYFSLKQWFKVKNIDGFAYYKQLFVSQDINWWSGVDYLWILTYCFYQMFELFILTSPIHWWASDAFLHFSKTVLMKKQTHLHIGWPGGEYISAHFHFW